MRNRELMAILRRVLGVRVGIPLRRWMLEVGSVLLGTETELLLKSRWVLPTRLEAEGTMPVIHEGDQALIEEPIDYLGVNVYSRVVVD